MDMEKFARFNRFVFVAAIFVGIILAYVFLLIEIIEYLHPVLKVMVVLGALYLMFFVLWVAVESIGERIVEFIEGGEEE